MEAGERMTVKIILTAIVLVGCNIVAAGAAGDADIQGGALLSWPKDYKGVAVIPFQPLAFPVWTKGSATVNFD